MEAMAAARAQVEHQLATLQATERIVRQEEITAEIIELGGRDGKPRRRSSRALMTARREQGTKSMGQRSIWNGAPTRLRARCSALTTCPTDHLTIKPNSKWVSLRVHHV